MKSKLALYRAKVYGEDGKILLSIRTPYPMSEVDATNAFMRYIIVQNTTVDCEWTIEEIKGE